MGDRRRPGDLAAQLARDLRVRAGREIRDARHTLGISQRRCAVRAGVSTAQFGRIERAELRQVSLEQLARAGRAVGLKAAFGYYPIDIDLRDSPQLAAISRFARLLAPPLALDREATLPGPGDQRAWDGRIRGGETPASMECESKLYDLQAMARRIAIKQRDDPQAGVVILVVNRTAHNRRVLDQHREALRQQFPLDGAAIARALRAGRVPPANGIILV